MRSIDAQFYTVLGLRCFNRGLPLLPESLAPVGSSLLFLLNCARRLSRGALPPIYDCWMEGGIPGSFAIHT